MQPIGKIITTGIVTWSIFAVAPAQPRAEENIENRAQNALARGSYLEAIDQLRAAAFPPRREPDPSAFSAWRDAHPFVGGLLDPAAIRAEPAGPLNAAVVDRYRRAVVHDALREIRTRAAATSIVILNESHYSPRDRAFALEVARELRPLGYSVLAVETLSNDHDPAVSARQMSRLVQDGYPRLQSGYFTKDPVFADFVRQSLAMGYQPVAYESTTRRRNLTSGDQVALREQEQTDNLMIQIFRSRPSAKVLIYVGYSHAAEVPLPVEGGETDTWMAARLKRMTGIDPLTIDQTLIDETRPRHLAYRDLIADRIGNRPVTLFLDGRPLIEGRPVGAYDLQVIHPPLRLVRGRPAWLWRLGRRPVTVPRSLLPRSGRRLIQVFAAREAADSVPLDQIVIDARRAAPPLLVPRNLRLRWAYQDFWGQYT